MLLDRMIAELGNRRGFAALPSPSAQSRILPDKLLPELFAQENRCPMARSLFVTLLLLAVASAAPTARIARRDFLVPERGDLNIFVREVTDAESPKNAPAILLVHGARVPGLASFDLDVPGGSLAADLASHGLAVYVMDVRGYGSSTRPTSMSEPAEGKDALVRSNEAAHDIDAIVDWICVRRAVSKVALFGWATGAQWAGYYASIFPDKVSALILLNSLYGGSSVHPLMGHRSEMEDPKHEGQFNRETCGSYRLNTEKSLFGVWDRSIPIENKDAWLDPAVAKAYATAAIASDPSSTTRNPPSFRSPCGALEDSFYLVIGRQLWDASLITAPTLVLASERDFWSRAEDSELLQKHLVHASRVKVVVLKDATHFVHLDRPEHGRRQLIDEVTAWVK
jgi:pimeloyl-ACP methyl ester carboxylesterase